MGPVRAVYLFVAHRSCGYYFQIENLAVETFRPEIPVQKFVSLLFPATLEFSLSLNEPLWARNKNRAQFLLYLRFLYA